MERIDIRIQSLVTLMVCLPTYPLMRPTMRAYSHQGHGPRADQTGRIHISDFRNPRTISIAKRSRSIHKGQKRTSAMAGTMSAMGKRTPAAKFVARSFFQNSELLSAG